MACKAVILAAGKGARLSPLTPFIPKEMLPVAGFPVIHHVLAEASRCGVKDALVVLSDGKDTIKRYLTETVFPKGDAALLISEKREKLLSSVRISFAVQKELLGTAHAINLAKDFAATDPLLVMYPDDVLSFGDAANVPLASARLFEVASDTGCSVLLAGEIPGVESSQYGVLELSGGGDVRQVTALCEKPAHYDKSTAFVMIGRMVLSPRLLRSLERHPFTDRDGVIPALTEEAKQGKLLAVIHRGLRFDLGSHRGYENILKHTLIGR